MVLINGQIDVVTFLVRNRVTSLWASEEQTSPQTERMTGHFALATASWSFESVHLLI